MRSKSSRRHSSGFTLVELIISIVLIGILATVGSSMIVDSFRTTRMVNADNASTAQARYALERLAREIREVKYNGTSVNYCITTWTASNLVFNKMNVGSTNVDNCNTEISTVNIIYSSPNLSLRTANVDYFLSNQVDTNGFRFDYYQSDGTTAATTTSNISYVKITLTVKDPTSGQSMSQRTRVALRNV